MTILFELMEHFPQWRELLLGVQKPDMGSRLLLYIGDGFKCCLCGQVWLVWSEMQVKRPEAVNITVSIGLS